jgi:hypothetical protein
LVNDLLDGRNDVGIGAAPAQIAAQQLADLIGATGLASAYEPNGGTDLTRCAIAALKGIVVDEGLLHGMQGAVAGEALDGGDVGPVLHYGQGQAGVDATAIDQNRAGTALAVVTALFRSRQIETVAERIKQCRPGGILSSALTPLTVNLMGMLCGGTVSGLALAREAVAAILRSPLPRRGPLSFPM